MTEAGSATLEPAYERRPDQAIADQANDFRTGTETANTYVTINTGSIRRIFSEKMYYS